MKIMCGIAGIIDVHKQVAEVDILRMTNAIRHRGPDDEGIFINNTRHVSLGHRRLAFLDLTEKGRQPLCNEDGTVWITFNGEIYNYAELKKALEQHGHRFQSNTDSEVLVHGYEQWGVRLLDKLVGMWAFAIWDEKKQTLFAARDRFGIKPFYYGEQKGMLVFASELKAIAALTDFKRTLNFTAFADYFNYRYVPSPNTIWNELKKLPPAHFLLWRNNKTELHEYWQLHAGHQTVNHQKLINEIDELLFHTIQLHSVSDVPVGALLSGGFDSSAIVYYLHRAGYPLRTFSIGFKNWENSEHIFAEKVASRFNAKHTSYIVDDQQLELLDHLSWVYDEPLADISTLPTFIVSKVAAEQVKAVMSGEGSDEIFVGYTWQRNFKPLSCLQNLKYFFEAHQNPYPVAYYAEAMAMGRMDTREQHQLLSPDLHAYIRHNSDYFYQYHYDKNLSPLKAIQRMDIKCFMAELVLAKVDRASMANSLEVRVPFLHHQLFEKIFSLHESMYHHPVHTKWLLYEQLKANLPQEILSRKKQGFVGPDTYYMNKQWLRKELANSRLVKDGLVNAGYVNSLLMKDYDWRLWKLIVMEKWYNKWM